MKQPTPKPHIPRVRSKSRFNTSRKKPSTDLKANQMLQNHSNATKMKNQLHAQTQPRKRQRSSFQN